MDVVLATVKCQCALIYTGDTFLFSRTQNKLLDQIEDVLKPLNIAGMTTKLMKCLVFNEIMAYLDYIIASGKVPVPRRTTKAIKALQCPTAASDQRSFFSMCSVYRLFLPNFAKLVPLL